MGGDVVVEHFEVQSVLHFQRGRPARHRLPVLPSDVHYPEVAVALHPVAWPARRRIDQRHRKTRGEWTKAKSLAYDALILAALLALLFRCCGLVPAEPWLRESLLWFAIFFLLNLPQSVYVWREPEMEADVEAAK